MEETKYLGNYIKVTEELIKGRTWERVYLSDGVMVFPITDEGKIILIKENRPHETPPVRLKFVTGTMDQIGENPLKTANREMQEEIGLTASKLEVLLERKSTGTVNNNFYQVIATGLSAKKIPNPDGEDSILSIHPYSIQEIKELLASEQLPWSMGALGIFKIEMMLSNGTLILKE